MEYGIVYLLTNPRTQGQVSVPLNNNSAKCGLMNEPEGTKRSFS